MNKELHSVQKTTIEKIKQHKFYIKIKNHFTLLAKTKPARLSLLTFLIFIFICTLLLCLPISTQNRTITNFTDALFTATSAVCVTGLTTVDTATHWSIFGQTIILLGIKVGGLGIMTLSGVFTLLLAKKIGLTQKIVISSQSQTSKIGEVKKIIKAILLISTISELIVFGTLFLHFYYGNIYPFFQSIWHSAFMAISIFNNAGFINMLDNIEIFSTDIFVLLPIIIGTISGGIGFTVITTVTKHIRKPKLWDLHTKLTITTYFALTVIGTLIIAFSEWTNTLHSFTPSYKILNSLLISTTARTCGISTLDISQMDSSTLFIQDILMFIGGGSTSTAGGIKVTTLAVLLLAIITEARGDKDIEAFGKRIPTTVTRMSIAILIIAISLVSVSTFVLLSITDFSLDAILYETVSAFATVGLSTGITPLLPTAGKYIIIILMFTGKIGVLTLTTAIALRNHQKVLRKPAEKPCVG